MPVDEARDRVLARFERLETESLGVEEAHGFVLANSLRAPHSLPSFDNSAMDGYAVRADDVVAASSESPVVLPVTGEVRAGVPGEAAVTSGTAVRIMTGGKVPEGADAIVPVEDTTENEGTVAISASTEVGRHVRPAGDDVAKGDVIIEAGTLLRSGELALLASLGLTPIDVHRRPRVAILVTGDELVDPAEEPAPGAIRDSNSIALTSLCDEAGAIVVTCERVGDDIDAHRSAFEKAASDADVLITSGGVAVGKYDFVKAVVEELGSIDLWRVAMQPGKPVVLGSVLDTPFLGLPGNPVSVHVGFEQFVRPALRKMAGHRYLLRPRLTARLGEPLEKRPGRRHYVRVRLARDGDGWIATPTGAQGSHIQSSLVDCHGVAIFETEESRLESGAEVVVEIWQLPGL
ncbi:MAG: molybdopterin molybdotransferase [Actinomycetota bacterium]|nr:molybdopterin molybdotransferase [Actinomycetota bacterium]